MPYLVTTPDGVVRTAAYRSELRRIVPDPVKDFLAALESPTCWVCRGRGEVRANNQAARKGGRVIPCPRCNREAFRQATKTSDQAAE